ncbi:hypothetical protein GCM10011571_26870 [Marinithermofilum abyssi]|uniref:Carboxypeptidase regulatory-like domain-containing protein n=1 Tax=Marinithermofilum abyssi TaxID=1571185 RepID=A0A8J2YEG7_9BACL|nr:hypothetical protein [Marinithermofilum abyssi]GGE23381.1 hypothetical protein GCM10011571_26870 [Marinithermofilum abyssi]
MKRYTAVIMALFFLVGMVPGQVAAKEIHPDITVKTGLVTDRDTGKVEGIRVKARLATDQRVKGTWKFRYRYYQKVRTKEGKNITVKRTKRLYSKKGRAWIPIEKPGERKLFIVFKGKVGNQVVEEEKTVTLEIPRMRMWADKKKGRAPTHIQGAVTGKAVKGRWAIAVARQGGRILHLHEGGARIVVDLPPGEYLLRGVFYGEVDGSPLAMEETKRLVVGNKESDTYVIKGLNNEFRTTEEARDVIKGMKQSGWLTESDRTYADQTMLLWWAAAGVILTGVLGWLVYRRNRR